MEHELLFLSDSETYSGVPDSYVYVLTEEGYDKVSHGVKLASLDSKHIVRAISVEELLDFYFLRNNHGEHQS